MATHWALRQAGRRRLALAGAAHEIVVSDAVAATPRDLRLPDPETERLVFRMRAHRDGASLSVTDDDLEVLIGIVTVETDLEPDRRRRRRLEVAIDCLTAAYILGSS